MPAARREARLLLAWYSRHKRDLPWRTTMDPYRIWVSEAMLQQTQVATVIPYYERFLKRFPTLKALARADRQDVLKAWEGLGYYRRAQNLHEGARAVLTRHGGRFPRDPQAILALPGVGPYTAGAIRSIALGQDAALVDGNVERVLARLLAIRKPLESPALKRRLWKEAGSLLPRGRAGDFNQALMELGALVCVPREPLCPRCPLGRGCKARALGLERSLPRRLKRKALPERREVVAVLVRGGRLCLERRPEGGLLGGLWEFPRVPASFGKDPGRLLGRFRQAFTHFRLEAEVRAYVAPGTGRRQPGRQWVDARSLDGLPVTRLTRRIQEAWLGLRPTARSTRRAS